MYPAQTIRGSHQDDPRERCDAARGNGGDCQLVVASLGIRTCFDMLANHVYDTGARAWSNDVVSCGSWLRIHSTTDRHRGLLVGHGAHLLQYFVWGVRRGVLGRCNRTWSQSHTSFGRTLWICWRPPHLS